MSIIKSIRQYRLFSIQIASHIFSPGVAGTLITAALLYLMMSLGFWQLDRADFKNTLQQTIEDRKNIAATSIEVLPDLIDERRYLPVIISGTYDIQHTFLLDNKTLKGRVGYHVFTPVKMSDSKAVLVARGFVAMPRLRTQLPEFNTPELTTEFSGLLDLPPSRALILAENVQQTEHWPAIMQYIDLDEISKILGYELYDMVLWLDENKNEGKIENDTGALIYDLPVLNLNAAKNSGYAFQWFAMSLALFIIFIVVNTKRITE